MSETVTLITPPIDRSLYSLHPEEDMTERRGHDKQLEYFVFALERTLPNLFVARNLAVYWVPGQMQDPWAGPDILVSRHHPRVEDPSVYLVHEEGPLAFVCEVASTKTRGNEATRRDETYAQALAVPEHLFIDHDRQVLELSELVNGRYERIVPDAEGRHWSRALGIGFVWESGRRFVRVVTALAEVVPTAQEETARRYEAEVRAAEAERRAREERQQRTEAEARAAEEARQRTEAEARAAEQVRQRTEAEARAETLAAEVERLRRALERPEDTSPSG